MLDLSTETLELLRGWIGHSTWHSGHELDKERFYRFVRGLWEEKHDSVDRTALNERIVAEALSLYQQYPTSPNWTEEGIRAALDSKHYARDAILILNYLAATESLGQ
jgi:hypothetical protein